MTIDELIEKLEKADGPNFALEQEIQFVLERHRGNLKPPNYTASLDAAVALAERVLPGWMWSMTTGLGHTAAYVRDKSITAPDKIEGDGYHATPALALCLATLKAVTLTDIGAE